MDNSLDIITTLNNGVREITFNRPNKKNAFNQNCYLTVTKILSEDADNDEVVLTILTGNGDFFSSGNDLKSQSTSLDPIQVVDDMVNAFILYPKILVAVLNGPAIGIAATVLGLCDIVYCSENAYIELPFVRLGISMEGCSSYIFPQILGRSKFSELLYFNHKLTAREAVDTGFAAKIIPKKDIPEFIKSLHRFGSIPVKTVIRNKKLYLNNVKDHLIATKKKETEALYESFSSREFSNAVILMMQKGKSKSKL